MEIDPCGKPMAMSEAYHEQNAVDIRFVNGTNEPTKSLKPDSWMTPEFNS